MKMELNARKLRILKAIVDDYIISAVPVGSRTITKKYMSELSPATIRNEMADLEEMGFLESPILPPAASPPIRHIVCMWTA